MVTQAAGCTSLSTNLSPPKSLPKTSYRLARLNRSNRFNKIFGNNLFSKFQAPECSDFSIWHWSNSIDCLWMNYSSLFGYATIRTGSTQWVRNLKLTAVVDCLWFFSIWKNKRKKVARQISDLRERFLLKIPACSSLTCGARPFAYL